MEIHHKRKLIKIHRTRKKYKRFEDENEKLMKFHNQLMLISHLYEISCTNDRHKSRFNVQK